MHPALLKLKAFEKHPTLALQCFGERDDPLILRVVDLIQDLQLFYSWIEYPGLQVNWGLLENDGEHLARHYRSFLESENRQSFLIKKWEKPLFQFDIFLIHYHELYFRIPTTTGDCILNYIIINNAETKEDIKDALALQLDYFFSSPECRRLWLPVPEQQRELINIFTETGFKYKASYTARQQRYALFYMKRAEFTGQIRNKIVNISHTD